MKKIPNKKIIKEEKETKPPEIYRKREEELQEIDRIAKMLVRRDFELLETREKREEEIRELEKTKKELEEIRTTLEIRVQARTKELERLAESLDEQVKEKTKELKRRLGELERFQRLTVGRELKMIELKKALQQAQDEIKKLKKELKNNKP